MSESFEEFEDSTSVVSSEEDFDMEKIERCANNIKDLSDQNNTLSEQLISQNNNVKASNKCEILPETQKCLRRQLLWKVLSDADCSERLDFLTKERARLHDELLNSHNETENAKQMSVDAARSLVDLQQLLDEEREDFEDDIADEKERSRRTLDDLLKKHEIEVKELMNSRNESKTNKTIKKNASYEEGDETDDDMKDDINQLNERIQEILAENQEEQTNYEIRISERDVTIDKLRNEIDRQGKTTVEVQMALKKSNSDKKSVEIQLNFSEQKIEDISMNEKKLQNQIKALVNKNSEQNNELDEEKEELLIRIKKLEEDIELSNKKLHSKDKQIMNVENKLRLKSENSFDKNDCESNTPIFSRCNTDEKRASFNNIKQHLANVLESKRTLSSERSNITDELDVMKQQLKTKEQEIVKYENNFEDLRNENLSFSEKINENKIKYANLECEIEKLNLKLKSKLIDNEDYLRTSIDFENTQKISVIEDKYKNKLSESKSEVERFKNEMNKLSEIYETLKEKQRETHCELDKQNVTISRKEMELDRLKEESTIWKSKFNESEQRYIVSNEKEHKRRLSEEMAEIEDASKKRRIDDISRDLTLEKEITKSLKIELDSSRTNVQKMSTDVENKIQECSRLQSKVQNLKLEIESRDNIIRKLKIEIDEQIENIKTIDHKNNDCQIKIRRLENNIQSLESSNNSLRQDLTKDTMNDAEASITVLLKASERRSSASERQLDEVTCEMQTLQAKYESQMRELKLIKGKLFSMEEELSRTHNNLESESRKSCQSATCLRDVEVKLSASRRREKDLSGDLATVRHRLLDAEAKIEVDQISRGETVNITDKNLETKNYSDKIDDSALSLPDSPITTTDLQQNAILQMELNKIKSLYELQLRKYQERKFQTKLKLGKAREIYNNDKRKYRSLIEKQNSELKRIKEELENGQTSKKRLQRSNSKLNTERKSLISKLTNNHESREDQERLSSQLRVRIRYLEDENQTLEQRVAVVLRQKSNMSSIMEKYHNNITSQYNASSMTSGVATSNSSISPSFQGRLTPNSITSN